MSSFFALITDNYIFAYFIFVNIVSAIVFLIDKFAAIQGLRRVPEITLHGFEMFGGAFINLLLMYLISHKNQKASYAFYTWLFFVLWTIVLILNYIK